MAALEPEGDVLDTGRAGSMVIRGGVARGLGYVASTGLALLGVALITRHLGVADFGKFQTVLSLITVVGTVTDAGMATLGMREYSQRRADERHQLMGVLLGLRLVLTLIGAAVAGLIALAIGYDSALLLGTMLAGLGLALTVVQTTLTIPLAADLRNTAIALIDLLRQAITVVVYAALVALGAGVTAFLGATIPAGLILVGVVAVVVQGRFPFPLLARGPAWSLLSAAAAFAMATAVGTIYLYASQILTAAVTDARATGLFSAAFRVFVVIGSVPGLLITVAFPLLSRAARDDRERLRYAVQRLLDTTAILGLGASIALVVGAPAIVEVMAGSGFADAVPVLRIQGATLVATFVLAPIGFALLSIHAHREILVANGAALVVMLAAVASLASAGGAEGAAIGTVIGESALAAGYLFALRSADRELSPHFGRALRALAVAAPSLIVGIGLLSLVPSWIAAAAALAAYLALLVLARAVPDELLEVIPGRRSA